jgi:hypothetical protein
MTEAEAKQKREETIWKIAGVETRLKVAFWGWYLDPTSPTLMNAKQSALRAGFPEEQANAITLYKWFRSATLKEEVYSSAEKVLQEMLDLSPYSIKLAKDGSVFEAIDPALIKIKQDTAKFIASTLGKKDYSQRNELTGRGGGAIETKKVPVTDEEFEDIINAYAKRSDKRQSESRDTEEDI